MVGYVSQMFASDSDVGRQSNSTFTRQIWNDEISPICWIQIWSSIPKQGQSEQRLMETMMAQALQWPTIWKPPLKGRDLDVKRER
jgi:hypothetical protein